MFDAVQRLPHEVNISCLGTCGQESGEGQGGYAKESSDAFKKVQQETFRTRCRVKLTE